MSDTGVTMRNATAELMLATYNKLCKPYFRNAVIEECARRVLSWSTPRGYNMDVAKELADAIRALKDKP